MLIIMLKFGKSAAKTVLILLLVIAVCAGFVNAYATPTEDDDTSNPGPPVDVPGTGQTNPDDNIDTPPATVEPPAAGEPPPATDAPPLPEASPSPEAPAATEQPAAVEPHDEDGENDENEEATNNMALYIIGGIIIVGLIIAVAVIVSSTGKRNKRKKRKSKAVHVDASGNKDSE